MALLLIHYARRFPQIRIELELWEVETRDLSEP
jgi:hypothetical protein